LGVEESSRRQCYIYCFVFDEHRLNIFHLDGDIFNCSVVNYGSWEALNFELFCTIHLPPKTIEWQVVSSFWFINCT